MDNQVPCYCCQSNDKTANPCPGPLQPVLPPDGPWPKDGVDIVGLLKAATLDCRFAIALIDCWSEWPEVSFVRDTTTRTLLTFISTVFSCHGNPLSLVTDNGVHFTSAFFMPFLQETQITHHKSSLYTQQPKEPCNGSTVRSNKMSIWPENIISSGNML